MAEDLRPVRHVGSIGGVEFGADHGKVTVGGVALDPAVAERRIGDLLRRSAAAARAWANAERARERPVTATSPVSDLWPLDPGARGAVGSRALNCLHRSGMRRVAAVTAMTAADVLDLRNAGVTVLAEIRRALAAHGLALKGEACDAGTE